MKLQPSIPQYGFSLLLVALFALIIVPPFFPESSKLVPDLLMAMVMLASLYLVARSRRDLIVGLILALPPLLSSVIQEGDWSSVKVVMSYGGYAVFMLFMSQLVMRYLYQTVQVTVDMLYAAVCLYMFIAVMFSSIYICVIWFYPDSFSFPQGSASDANNLLLYYSVVTLSTLGYGDILPTAWVSRNLAIVETVIGQFFLAFTVARLVSLYTSSIVRDKESKS